MKLTIGFVTYNNLKYTKLCVQSFRDTVKTPFEFFVVDGFSTDDTVKWLKDENIPFLAHMSNMGSCVGVNDIFDKALQDKDDYLLLCGNDVMAYPGAVDEMVKVAEETQADWVWANELKVSDFCGMYQKYAKPEYFDKNYRLVGDSFKDYLKFTPVNTKGHYAFKPIRDYRNFCLISNRLIDKIGFSDVNFYPSGYYEDNDFCRRAYLAGAKAVMVENAWFFHFWSRSLFEGGIVKTYGKYLDLNSLYYFKKWGGMVGEEKFNYPFAEKSIVIKDRIMEKQAVEFWSSR